MKKPIQLIIDGVVFPTSTHDRYTAYSAKLKQQVEMISTRMTEEVRGDVWKIIYNRDSMSDAEYKACMAVLTSTGKKTVNFLPNTGDGELLSSEFLVESITYPSLAFYSGGVPKWRNLSFTLREVKPHA